MRRILMSLALLVFAIPALAADHFLEADGSGDFPTIQAAIDAAQSGDTIWLNSGTYSGAGNRDLYMYQDIDIKSSNPAEPTVISCRGSSLFPHNAFTFETCSPTLYGLTIEDGYSADGGAVTLIEASPTFSYCIFRDNDATGNGGAIDIGSDSIVLFEYTVFDHNTAGGDGGALYATTWAEVTVDQCTFIRNKANRGSSVFMVEDATCAIDRSILSFGLGGAACSDYYGGGYTITCTNVAMNDGGDWVLSISGMNGVGGNISADPQLCDPMAAAPLYGASMNSPSAIAACGWQGAVAPDFTWENPVYGVLTDDQGMFPTIQAAIDGVVPGGVIGLEDDIYTGTGNRDLIGQGNLFTLAARGTNPAACILDCQGTPGDPHRVIRFVNDDPSGTVIRGVTLTGGYLTTGSGGAVLIQNGSSPQFEDCIFRDNTVGADGGGAMAIFGAPGNYSHTELHNCIFENNVSGWDGGAIVADYWRHFLRGCDFSGNQAGHNGGDFSASNFLAGWISHCTFTNGVSVYGHSVHLESGLDPSHIMFCDFSAPHGSGNGSLHVIDPDSLLVTGCDFIGNGGINGGAIHTAATVPGQYLEIDDCSFTDNDVYDGGGNGGAIYGLDMELKITDSIFTGNLGMDGGAFYANTCNVEMAGCSFEDNWAAFGSAMYTRECTLVARNCVASSNSANVAAVLTSNISDDEFWDCDFLDNVASNQGGVAAGFNGTSMRFTRCMFAGNRAGFAPAVNSGSYGELTMDRCTLFDNSSTVNFGTANQISVGASSHVDLIECLITHGSKVKPVGTAYESGTATAYNCNFHGNYSEGRATNYDGLMEGQLGVNGNISEYPLYCDTGARDLTLNESSICLAPNNPNSANIGARGVGCYGVTPVGNATPAAPVVLEGNHPNPFNPRTEIRFTLGVPDAVRLEIFDVGGRLIRTLVDGDMMDAGPHGVVWEGMNDRGSPASSGIYFYRFEAGAFVGTGRMALLK